MRVPLLHGYHAMVDVDDFNKLMADGIPDQWVRNHNGQRRANGDYSWYVRVMMPGANLLMVARLILGVSRTELVHYRDWNPLNLRRNNLATGPALAARRDATRGGAGPQGEQQQ